jgi:hypothetical protein
MMRRAAVLVALVGMNAAGAASVEVHPTGPSIPENLLRIELRFDRPQQLPFDIAHVRLVDSSGMPIDDALLDLTLPNADGRRITLLMNPGRVKTGVGPNVAEGRALRAGATVRLLVDDPSPGASPVIKEWTVTDFDAKVPRPTLWQLNRPRARSRDTLIIDLLEPISSAAEALIAVRDPAGRRVAGRTSLSDGDSVWRFIPDKPWRNAPYEVLTHPDLEDPAGNRTCALFEQVGASEDPCDAGVTIPFEPRISQGQGG